LAIDPPDKFGFVTPVIPVPDIIYHTPP